MVLYGGWLTDAGSILGKTARGILGIGGKTINVLTTRGGADATTDIYEEGGAAPAQDFTMPLLIGGAALAAVFLLKGKR